VSKLAGARKAALPSMIKPQLATLAEDVPTGDDWLHELKFDGYRILAIVKNSQVRLISRNGKDWTKRFPGVAAAVGELTLKQGILDGEVVSLNEKGVSDFQQLQNALKRGDEAALVYYVFDLPYFSGHDLTGVALVERKRALAQIFRAANARNDGLIRYSDHVQGEGAAVLEQACRGAMEGIVSKRMSAKYEQTRSRTWLKVKCVKRQEFVVAGYTKPSGARVGLGALLLGYHKDGELVYAGRVGTGFTDESLRQLVKELKPRRTKEPPFARGLTAAQRRGVTWVKPELVAEVEFTEWTDESLLRHPSFQGLREDKPPKQVTREEVLPMPRASKPVSQAPAARVARAAKSSKTSSNGASSVAGIGISHPDRILYPEMGITKLALAHYYEQVADWALPHIVDRPLTLVRCPTGRGGECFYQKHLNAMLPASVRGVMIREKENEEEYVVVDDLPGLIALVQIGVLEMHPWPARADKIEAPDRLVFDFDPGEGVTWPAVVDAARETRDRLGELGLETFLRTSGGKGLHVVAPLARRNSWEQLKSFAKAVADDMVRRSPARYIATLSKAKRRGKIFVDYLRNQRGATAIASFSTRARAGAPVAAPLAWSELSTRLKPNAYTVVNMPRRLARLTSDPWEGFFHVRQSITQGMIAALT
jgi:bifunctional non-homologous end joining protein LigD